MGKKGKKTTRIPFSQANIDIINAKKLQEQEHTKTQGGSRGGTSRGDKKSGKSRKPTGNSSENSASTSSTIQKSIDTNVLTDEEPKAVKSLSKETSSPELQKPQTTVQNTDKVGIDPKGTLQSTSEKLEETSCNIMPSTEPIIVNTMESKKIGVSQNNSEKLKQTSVRSTPSNESNIGKVVENRNIEVDSNITRPSMTQPKQDMPKSEPNNSEWIRNSASPQSTKPPFGSVLNPDALEYIPVFGNLNQQSHTTPPIEAHNIVSPLVVPVITEQMTNIPPNSIPPDMVSQAPDFQLPTQSNREFSVEPSDVPTEHMPVMTTPVDYNSVPRDHENPINTWQAEQPQIQYDQEYEEKSELHFQDSQDVHETVQHIQETSLNLPAESNFETKPIESTPIDDTSHKDHSSNWSDDNYTEPSYSAANQEQDRHQPSHDFKRNQYDNYNKNDTNQFDDRKNDRRGGRRGNRGDRGSSRMFKSSSRERSYQGYNRSEDNQWKETNRDNSKETYRKSEEVPQERRNNYTPDSFNKNFGNRERGFSRGPPRGPNRGYHRNDNRRPYGRDDAEYPQSHNDERPKSHEVGRKSESNWRERPTEDFNKNRYDTRSRFNDNKPGYPRDRENSSSYGRRDNNRGGKNTGRGNYTYGKYQNNKDQFRSRNRENSEEPVEIINDESTSKDSSDNYHITDEDSNDIPQKNVELNKETSEDGWGNSGVTQGNDAQGDNEWGTLVEAANDGIDWNVDVDAQNKASWGSNDQNKLAETQNNEAANQYASDLPDARPTTENFEQNQGNGKKESDVSHKGEQLRKPWNEPKKRDPRMDREKWGSSLGSNDSLSSGAARTSERNFRQTRITNYTDQDSDRGTYDRDYDRWEAGWTKIKDFHVVKEIYGDLFDQPKDYSLAHCVAEDLRMGSGIAVDFKREFKSLPDLLDQRARQGGLATIHDPKNGRFVYYLVTKRESTGKPTYLTLWRSLTKMRDHIRQHEVKKLAIPRLGCGLDRLEWVRVKSMIEYLFTEVDVDITVCNLQQEEEVLKKIPDMSIGSRRPKTYYKYW